MRSESRANKMAAFARNLRSVHVRCLPVAALALFSLLPASGAYAQTISGEYYPGGNAQTLNANQTVYIDPTDGSGVNFPMPAMDFMVLNPPSGTAQIDWEMNSYYVDQDQKQPSEPELAGITSEYGVWQVTAYGNSEGGDVEVEADFYDCAWNKLGSATFNFYILGKNQTEAQTDQAYGSAPWFFSQILLQESAGTGDQFAPNKPFPPGISSYNVTGQPLWGSPDGIGIGQVDMVYHFNDTNFPYNGDMYWNYEDNIQEAIDILNEKASESRSNWTSQYADSGNTDPSPYDLNNPYTYCHFVTNTQPLGNHSFGDADWIQDYNGHSNQHWYLWWTPEGWKFKYSTSEGGYNYVPSVCNRAPY